MMISQPRCLIFVVCILTLNACSTTAPIKQQAAASNDDLFQSCVTFYEDIDANIQLFDIQDAQTFAIRGYPYLHSNRLLASYAPLVTTDTQDFWLEQLQKLGMESLVLASQNLPSETKIQLLQKWQYLDTKSKTLSELIEMCGKYSHDKAAYNDKALQYLKQQSKIPDHYTTWWRAVGIYPIVSYFMAKGISNWHKESTTALTRVSEHIPVEGEIYRYTSKDPNNKLSDLKAVESILTLAAENPLKIPLPSKKEMASLFATYAPIWEIDTVTDNDKVGAVYWPAADALPKIDLEQPTMYQLASHVHFYGKTLLQLNYFIWVPQRPCTSGFDFLCGQIDGLIWRVTLKENGEPLLYDSIHSCGCYHTFFPVDDLKLLPPKMNVEETAFVPIKAPKFRIDKSLTVRLSSVSHYLDAVFYSDETNPKTHSDKTITYETKPYNSLRSLRINDKEYKSLFKANGLVAGTERKERWFFWPMGIASAGAMRQWGTHATAFVGRRHFDDPCLLENSFLPLKPSSESRKDDKTQFNYLCVKNELENNQN